MAKNCHKNMNSIDFNNVVKSYGSKLALDRFSLSIKKGEIFALVGLNGAGKTTAIKALLGLIQIQTGSLKVFSNEFNPSETGFAPEFPETFPFLTVQELLAYCLSFHKNLEPEEKQEKIKFAMELFGLEELGNQRIATLSKGNAQKASLAAAVVHRPKLVIFDEPVSGLDPMARATIKSAIKKLNEEGATVIFTTHVLTDVTELCHKIGLVHQGQLIFCGPPKELCTQTKTEDLESAFIKLISDPASHKPVEWVDLAETKPSSTRKPSITPNLRQASLAAGLIIKNALRSNLIFGAILLMLPFLWGSWVLEQSNPGFQTGFIADMGTILTTAFAAILAAILALEHLFWAKSSPTPFFHLSRMNPTTYALSRFLGILGVVAPATAAMAAILMAFIFFNTGAIIFYPMLMAVFVIAQVVLALGLLTLLASQLPRLSALALLIIFYIFGMELEPVRAYAETMTTSPVQVLLEFILVFVPDFSILKLEIITPFTMLSSMGYALFQGMFYLLLGGGLLTKKDL